MIQQSEQCWNENKTFSLKENSIRKNIVAMLVDVTALHEVPSLMSLQGVKKTSCR